jgi:hypothetical protein
MAQAKKMLSRLKRYQEGGEVIGERTPYDSELKFFKENPNVGGMMAEDEDAIVMNPYSSLTKQELDAVRLNERARVLMRREGAPSFELTQKQQKMLSSMPFYKEATPEEQKATIAARVLSGDPSAGEPTEEQLQFVKSLRQKLDNMSGSKKMLNELRGYQEGGEVEMPEEQASPVTEAAKQMLFYKKTAAPTPPTDLARLGKQAGLIGLGFAPGSGVADYFGKFPAVEGGTEPSAVENFQKGNYGTAALQGLGAMGDLAMAVPVAGAAIGSVMKAPRTAQRILSSSTTAKDDLAKMPKKLAPANESGFYSPTEAAALNLQRKSGAGQAFLNDIMKGENVKSDEISAMGLDTFLKGKTNVTADEVRDYIAQNKIKLGETRYGRPKEDPVGMAKRKDVFDKYDPQIKSLYAEIVSMPLYMKAGDRSIANPRLIRMENDLNDLQLKRDAEADAVYKIPENKDTKFQGYALPGGQNYREIVLTLPDPKDALMSQVKALGITKDKDKITVNDILQRGGSDELADNWLKSSQDVYKTRHWDEPNALSHLRVSDRVTDGKKTLLVDEVQSDWHQVARDLRAEEVNDLVKSGMSKQEAQASVPKNFGYKSGSKPLDWNDPEYVKARSDAANALNAFNAASGNRALQATLRAELDRASLVEFNLVNQANKFHRAVPDAPYKDDWYQLTLRRAIKEAVDGGYDRVALPTGAKVAERFNLIKQIDNVALYMDELRAYDKAGNTIFAQATDGGKDLSKILGEKNAERLLNSGPEGEVRYLGGLDIKTGGEGMAKYYDEIYPTYLQKFGKKYGAESGKTTLDVKGKPEPLFYMEITPKMREEFTSGIPMREGGEVRRYL